MGAVELQAKRDIGSEQSRTRCQMTERGVNGRGKDHAPVIKCARFDDIFRSVCNFQTFIGRQIQFRS